MTEKVKKPLPAGFIKWQEHLKKVRAENTGKSLKECMQIAKLSFKK
jgi:hypothetical protein